MRAFFQFLVLSAFGALAQDKAGWTCNKTDGFWYENGKKSSYGDCEKDGGKDKKGGKIQACTTTDPGANTSISNLPRTCINHSSGASSASGPRCWWTYVPTKFAKAGATKKPLVIDMHGGGGCAYHQWNSGWRELSEVMDFVVIFPQGRNMLWASCGSQSSGCKAEQKGGKQVADWDDVGFLEQLITNVVRNGVKNAAKASFSIDPERIYLTGFSMGCMMSNRMAMERSKLIAGFSCHGGELNMVGFHNVTELAAMKKQHMIQPMPAYLTVGTNDPWGNFTKPDYKVWSYWNGCNTTATDGTTSQVQMSFSKTDAPKTKAGTSITSAVESRCAGKGSSVETRLVLIKDGLHTLDKRMANHTWTYLKHQKRAGVLAQLSAAVQEVDPPSSSKGSPSKGSPSKGKTTDKDGSSKTSASHSTPMSAVWALALLGLRLISSEY
eukprot:TRINITY_DN63261_c0_g1_i1.p1 TRINITY_DN63261_c0_g1~~TRINITY_DN63261_c0_g1_i1.p1  ORF type:complete len:439 (-),score=70.34 TRINITY_DN63261_c0_g1_i1:21-1337(-)